MNNQTAEIATPPSRMHKDARVPGRSLRDGLCILILLAAVPSFLPAGTWTDRAQTTSDPAACAGLWKSLEGASGADAELARGITAHNLARADPALWVPRALALLEPLAPSDALAQAWYGSALTLKGSLALKNKDVLTAATVTQQGLDVIDRAVARDPSCPGIRLLRAENGVSVSQSSPFDRWEAVAADLAWFEARSPSDPVLKATLQVWKGELALHEGKVGRALEAFAKAAALAPGSSPARHARERLAQLEE